MVETALLDVRVLPWRPRARVMNPQTLRANADLGMTPDDLGGVVLSLALWLFVIIAAPVLVIVLAVGLLSVERPIVLALAVLLAVVRFGLLPWTVVVVHQVSGKERVERYRALWRAVRRIRAVNHDRRVKVRWAWA